MYPNNLKRFALYLSIFLIFTLTGCTKTPINGNLDGEWEVMEVTPEPAEWDADARIFYNFQRYVCQLTFYGGPFTVGNLSYTGDEMSLNFPYIHTPKEISTLRQFGINTNPVTFNVTFENKRRLILYNSEVTIVLRKF